MKKLIILISNLLIILASVNIVNAAETNNISYEMAKAYLEVIENECGSNVGHFDRNSPTFSGNGLFNAKLVDLDGNGVNELIFTKLKQKNEWGTATFKICIYGFDGKNAVDLTKDLNETSILYKKYPDLKKEPKEFLVHFNMEGNFGINLYSENGKVYIVEYLEATGSECLEVYELVNNKLRLFSCSEGALNWDGMEIEYTNTIDGENYFTISQNDLNNLINKYSNDSSKSEVFWEYRYMTGKNGDIMLKFGADNASTYELLNELKSITL